MGKVEINEVADIKEVSEMLIEGVKKIIIGKDETIKLLIAAILAKGHILLEDVPGSGKTVLAKTIAKCINGKFKRIQMTPDLLPADMTGINYFNIKESKFDFIEGPVFTNILIADEINRATPKTQAGLLECMEEYQVTVEGKTYKLEEPFVVIATENPVDTQGVFPLPEAQIDRFMIKLSMSYPEHNSMVEVLKRHMNGTLISEVKEIIDIEDIKKMQEMIYNVSVSDAIFEYIVSIIEATRNHEKVILGMSQRAGLSLVAMSRSIAAMQGRSYVLPDDVKTAAPYVCAHRLVLKNSERIKKDAEKEIIEELLDNVIVPTEELI